MTGLLLGFGLCFAAGAYLLLADLFHVSTRANTKAILQAAKLRKTNTSGLHVLLFRLSTWLAERLPLTDYYKRKTEATLRSAGIRLTPEAFVAQAIIKATLIFCAGIALLPLLPLLSPLLIFLAIALFFKEIRSADELVRKKREQIEAELPRFVATISQELKASRDVLRILEVYASNAGEGLLHELQITIADMKSGNLETALIRLETRISSTMLSDLVRGLLAVLRGDQGTVYFEMLAHDFKLLEIQRLKRIAMKRPGKVRKYSFLMLGCFILTYMVIIGMEIFKALGKLF
ncbi:secretion protein F [Paenibacillus oralis]|uniref:Secretion protein F n=1 Tax=Paenibacillus oralis TaxID=2490856 RepID=A0A3P3UA65_9BACL|nr:secretion protein F [Paenibacillus oralis]RRJ67241.1 secretion protein F [Paenibacillus oralis]